MEDTIYSLATPIGRGPIAIVRVSGEHALSALKTLFRGEISNRKLCYGLLSYNGKDIDKAMAVFMAAPKTYTGEDVCEFHIHGGNKTVNLVLDALRNMGLRQALPGEFTKRAFLNGKIDLTQAEAVMSMVSANSDMHHKVAMEQMEGAGNAFVDKHKDTVLDLLAKLDVTIDYPDEDIETQTLSQVRKELEGLIASLEEGISTAIAGQILETGYKIAIVGRPNVGKSSLLNAILGKERVIVTDIPGTTRDALKESYLYKGQLFTFVDTAGIRETSDIIEQKGMEQSLASIKTANLVIALFDGSAPLSEEDKKILRFTDGVKRLIIANKGDLPKKTELSPDLTVSAKNKENITPLLDAIYREMEEDIHGLSVLTANRHITLANSAVDAFKSAVGAIDCNDDIECIEIHIREGWHNLCEITGAVFDEDIVNRIFEKFCLGK